jgi:hypothetical protein
MAIKFSAHGTIQEKKEIILAENNNDYRKPDTRDNNIATQLS